MRIPQPVATITATMAVGSVALALGMIVGLAAVPTVGPFGPPHTHASPTPSGIFTVDPATGIDLTIVQGITSGPCDVTGSDSFNAVVTGPGAFAANLTADTPDGHAIVSTSDVGFSMTDPMRFAFRSSFRNLAEELGTTIVPGDYVVNFRCVNGFEGTVFQIYTQTITFTTPATYVVADNPSAPELPSGDPPEQGCGNAPTGGQPPPDPAVAPVTRSPEHDEVNVTLVLVAVLVAVPAVLIAAYLLGIRRFPTRR